MNYDQLASEILVALGGKNNVVLATHCITRLRVKCVDVLKIEKEQLKNLDGVHGLIENDYEVQVVIGTDVVNVYSAFQKLIQDNNDIKQVTSEKEKLNVIDKVLKYLSGSIVPILPIICVAAVIGAVCTILTTFFGMNAESGTYIIFNTLYNAFFDFLPILIGFGAAKTLEINGYYGAFLGAILVHGNISGAEGLDFFGIALPTMNYGGTIIPSLLGIAFMACVDKYIGSKIPAMINFVFRPFVVFAITVPVTLLLLGPLGMYIGNYIAVAVQWLYETLGVFAIPIMAFVFPILIASGTGNAILPIFLQIYLLNGFDEFYLVASLMSNIAIGGAVLAVAVKAKTASLKQAAAAAGFTAVCGITEPALYGVAIPLKKPMLAGMIGGSIAGVAASLLGIRMFGFNVPGLITLPLFLSPDGTMTNFYFAIVSVVIAVLAGFTISYLIGFNEQEMKEVKS